MSRYRSILKVRAFDEEMAQPIRELRHFHVAPEPFVMAYVQMAAEPFSLWACLYGRDPEQPTWAFAVDPRNREEQRDVFEVFATDFVASVEECLEDEYEPLQLWVSNTGAASNLSRLGRVLRLRDPSDDMAMAGVHLDLYAQSVNAPASSLCVPATRALGEQKVTGQSDLEDANLAAQLVWWDKRNLAVVDGGVSEREAQGLSVFEAARRSEKLPMGTLTDPRFDEATLAPLLERATRARRKGRDLGAIEDALSEHLFSQVGPIWEAIWTAHGELVAIDEAPSVAQRWDEDARTFQWHRDFLASGGRRRFNDSPTRAVQLMSRWERDQANSVRSVITEDRLALVEAIVDNTAVAGTVTSSTVEKVGRSSHPFITIECEPTELTIGTEVWLRENLKVQGVIEQIEHLGKADRLSVHVVRGMKNNMMPSRGEAAVFITHAPGFGRQPKLSKELPWTHRGTGPEVIDDE